MKQYIHTWFLFAWLIVLFLWAQYQAEFFQFHQAAFVYQTDSHSKTHSPPLLMQHDVSKTTASVHSATLAYIQNSQHNQLMAAWFQGSREGARDVQIYASFLNLNQPDKAQWTEPKVIVNREILAQQSQIHLKKLGNPVLHQTSDGTIHLFVVGTSYGGWAVSRIFHLTSQTGQDFQFKQVLPLSPLTNISHLVRTPPVALQDGGFYLPIYHELAQKFEVLLRFNQQGELLGKIRPNPLVGALQPAVVATSEQDCISARRHNPAQLLQIQVCHQGGLKWEQPISANLYNYDNALNIIHFNQKNYVIHNQARAEKTRFELWLSELKQQGDGFLLDKQVLLAQANDAEVSYPTTLILGDDLHLVYTHDRQSIRHIYLNRALLAQYGNCWQQNKAVSIVKSANEIHCQEVQS